MEGDGGRIGIEGRPATYWKGAQIGYVPKGKATIDRYAKSAKLIRQGLP